MTELVKLLMSLPGIVLPDEKVLRAGDDIVPWFFLIPSFGKSSGDRIKKSYLYYLYSDYTGIAIPEKDC